METLLEYQHALNEQVNNNFYRFLYYKLPWESRMVAIEVCVEPVKLPCCYNI